MVRTISPGGRSTEASGDEIRRVIEEVSGGVRWVDF
jgi:hypothetical protein